MSHAFDKGTDLMSVKKILGQKNITTTEKYLSIDDTHKFFYMANPHIDKGSHGVVEVLHALHLLIGRVRLKRQRSGKLSWYTGPGKDRMFKKNYRQEHARS